MNKVARTSIILIIGTILSKLLGFVRELMVAYRFGANSISDAFILTNGIPSLIFVSIATAININYIPYYHRIDNENDRNTFTSNLANISVVILLVGCVLVCVFPKQVLKVFATGLPEDTERYAVLMLRIVVFSIIPIILSYIFQAYLQANELFVSTALYGIVINSTVILFTFIATEIRFYVLSIGTIISHTLGLILICYFVKTRTSFKYSPYIRFDDNRIKDMVLLTLPLMVEDVASSMSLIVDRNLASFLDKGSISGLGYAGTIANIASSMIAGAIITATFPLFSKMVATGDIERFGMQLETYASVISHLLGPIAVFLAINAYDIVTIIFERGAFDKTATKIVSESMICYVVGTLPSGLQSYLIRGFYALQDTKTPVKVKVFSLACNIVLNLLFVKTLKHMGIALSTSLSYVIAFFLLAYTIKKKHGIQNIWRITVEGFVSIIISLAPAIIVYLLFKDGVLIISPIIKLFIKSCVFFVGYVFIMMIFRRSVFNKILRTIKH